MGLPPSVVGAVQWTPTSLLLASVWTSVGAPGRPTGVTEFDAPEADPVPMVLVAVTVKL